LRERAGQRDGADQDGKGEHCAVIAPATPNTEFLMMEVATEITASVAITAALSMASSAASSSGRLLWRGFGTGVVHVKAAT
jgi:hypothetical protein